MAISDAIKAYRSGGSGSGAPLAPPSDIQPPAPAPEGRVIPLTGEEVKEFAPYADAPAIMAQVVGKLEGASFRVMSIRYEGVGEGGEGEQDDAGQVMSSPGSVPMQ